MKKYFLLLFLAVSFAFPQSNGDVWTWSGNRPAWTPLSTPTTGTDLTLSGTLTALHGVFTGNLTVSGTASFQGDATVSGIFEVGDNTTVVGGIYALGGLFGSPDAGGDLILYSTSHATKGNIYFGAALTSTYDEVNARWGFGTGSPQSTLTVGSVSAGTSEATYKGSIQIQSNGGATTSAGGLEFKTASGGSGYGSRIGVPDLGSGNTPMVFMFRSSSASWTERMRLKATGELGIGMTPTATLDVTEPTVGDAVVRFTSTATNDDPVETFYQARTTTTDATVTNLIALTLSSSKTVLLQATVTARRTGGTGGTAEDGAAYIIVSCWKQGAGSTMTQIGSTTTVFSAESQAGWDCSFTTGAGTNEVDVIVTGATNNNVTWHLSSLRIWEVGS